MCVRTYIWLGRIVNESPAKSSFEYRKFPAALHFLGIPADESVSSARFYGWILDHSDRGGGWLFFIGSLTLGLSN
jgi:hypothetical protein